MIPRSEFNAGARFCGDTLYGVQDMDERDYRGWALWLWVTHETHLMGKAWLRNAVSSQLAFPSEREQRLSFTRGSPEIAYGCRNI